MACTFQVSLQVLTRDFVFADCVRLDRLQLTHEAPGADCPRPAGEEPPALRPPPPQHAVPPVSLHEESYRCQTRKSMLREGGCVCVLPALCPRSPQHAVPPVSLHEESYRSQTRKSMLREGVCVCMLGNIIFPRYRGFPREDNFDNNNTQKLQYLFIFWTKKNKNSKNP